MKILTGNNQRQAEKLLANIGEVVYLVGGEKALHKVGKAAFNFDLGGEQGGMDKR